MALVRTLESFWLCGLWWIHCGQEEKNEMNYKSIVIPIVPWHQISMTTGGQQVNINNIVCIIVYYFYYIILYGGKICRHRIPARAFISYNR